MAMNGNLSQQQMKDSPAMEKAGASPIAPKFDGPAPIKTPAPSGVMQPNQSMSIPKPGFF